MGSLGLEQESQGKDILGRVYEYFRTPLLEALELLVPPRPVQSGALRV